MEGSKKLLLIIPFYNESARINTALYTEAFNKYPDCFFLLVDDGSKDNTAQILNDFCSNHANAEALLLKQNGGKAEAIRQAVLTSHDRDVHYIGYMDADLATPFEELIKIRDYALNHEKYDFLMGSRIKKLGNNIVRFTHRHYFGRFFASLVSQFILKTPVYDTQCGAKIINKDLAVRLFKDPFITKWLFDVELLLRFKISDPDFKNKVYEFSLNTWIEQGESKITLKDLLGFPYQLFKIRSFYVKS